MPFGTCYLRKRENSGKAEQYKTNHRKMQLQLNYFVQSTKKEFRRKKCGFDHTPSNDFVKSQWQNHSKSLVYLIYRWILVTFFTAALLVSMVEAANNSVLLLLFIYFTTWSVIQCLLTNLLAAILVTIWHLQPEYAANVDSLNAANILTHILNCICMFTDLLIVAHPLRLLHVFLPITYGLIYVFFSIVYQFNGGHNSKGKPYIYYLIDWRQPINSALYATALLMFSCCIYLILFVIYKLRILAYRQLNNSNLFLPAVQQSNTPIVSTFNNAVQHSPSSISMVLCQTNLTFNSTSESINKS
uniref:Protein rolling stone n=1 Tax=Glossina brevipalpis TaxID=37001 RepID=A0A1A9W871_9MUSC